MIRRSRYGLGRLPVAAGLAASLWGMSAEAHDLTITARLDGDSIVVTVAYDDGSRPADATVVFLRDGGEEILRTPLTDDGTARLDPSLAADGIADGLVVEAFDPEGHSSYRILTPADLRPGGVDP